MNTTLNLNEVDSHLDSIAAAYTEATYPQRLKKMLQGLKCARNTKDYKEALIEVQRLSAPIVAMLLPMALVGMLVVFSAAKNVEDRVIESTIIEVPPPPKFDDDIKPPEKKNRPGDGCQNRYCY